MIIDSSIQLIRTKRNILKLERQFAKLTTYARKLETRRKIELGGLVIKSGLAHESKAVILGALLEIKKEMTKTPEYKNHLQRLGEACFLGRDTGYE